MGHNLTIKASKPVSNNSVLVFIQRKVGEQYDDHVIQQAVLY